MRKFSGIMATVLVLAPLAVATGAERMDIVSEGEAGRFWLPAPGVAALQPGYPGVVAEKSPVCLSLGYKVGADGSTSDFTILKSWHTNGGEHAPEEAIAPFAQNAVAAVQQWKFVSAKQGKPRTIYTAATFAFAAAGADASSLRAHCAISNLPAYIAKQQSDAFRRGNLKKGEMERNRHEDQVLTGPGNY